MSLIGFLTVSLVTLILVSRTQNKVRMGLLLAVYGVATAFSFGVTL